MVDEPITLATLTTPPGRGGIAVIALAGPGAAEIVRKVFRPWKSHLEDRPGRCDWAILWTATESSTRSCSAEFRERRRF